MKGERNRVGEVKRREVKRKEKRREGKGREEENLFETLLAAMNVPEKYFET